MARYNNGLVITAEKTINILVSDEYDVPKTKVEHIPHGTRNFANRGRDETKQRYGLEEKLDGMSEFRPFIYNTWNQQSYDGENNKCQNV